MKKYVVAQRKLFYGPRKGPWKIVEIFASRKEAKEYTQGRHELGRGEYGTEEKIILWHGTARDFQWGMSLAEARREGFVR